MNSGHLTLLLSNPNDLEVLTQAHFLIGWSYTSMLASNVLEMLENRLSRYQFSLNTSGHTGRSNTFLSYSNEQSGNKVHLKFNAMLLIKENNLPSARCQLLKKPV